MKSIVPAREKFKEKIIKQYGIESLNDLSEKERNVAERIVEIKARIHTIIPGNCRNLTIDDFTGKYNGEMLLDNDVAVSAKKKIVKYCWGVELGEFNLFGSVERNKRSIIDKRRSCGTNVIICSNKFCSKRSGKTFAASLIMREAISIIGRKPGFLCWKHDWLSFSTVENDMRGKNSDLSWSCDWLVVDDILGLTKTRQAEAYIAELIDPFFQFRLDEGLPTILVFRFDISNASSIEERFGVAIGKIVNDHNTVTISL